MLACFCVKLRPFHRLAVGSYITLRIVPIPPAIKRFFSSEKFATEDKRIAPKIAPIFLEKATDKAELVKTLLRNYGFTETHFSKLVGTQRSFIAIHKKNLLPKLEFFRSIGLSDTDIPRIICRGHSPYNLSLENHLIPGYNFLKSLLPPDQDVVRFLKRCPGVLRYNMEKTFVPNVAALREAGAPQSTISSVLHRHPSAVCKDTHKFKESVSKAIGMGFNPMRASFGDAVCVFVEMCESTWEHKMEAYGRYGLSNDEILQAFRSHPGFMINSVAKITLAMDFLANKMGWPNI